MKVRCMIPRGDLKYGEVYEMKERQAESLIALGVVAPHSDAPPKPKAKPKPKKKTSVFRTFDPDPEAEPVDDE